MRGSREMQKIRRKSFRRAPSRDLLSISRQPVGDLPFRQYVHSRDRDGGFDSTCMKCFSIIGANTDELSLLASERKHVCPENVLCPVHGGHCNSPRNIYRDAFLNSYRLYANPRDMGQAPDCFRFAPSQGHYCVFDNLKKHAPDHCRKQKELDCA